MDDEPGLIGEFADDLDDDRGGVRDTRSVVGAVSEGALDEGLPPPRLLKQRHRAVAVLHVGRVNEQREYAPVGIHHGMTLAPHHLHAGIIAARAAGFGRLHALAVDDGRRRARLPADAGAVELDQMMVEALEHSIVPQLREPSVNRAPRRKAVGQEPPRTARPQQVEDRLDDLAHRPTSSPATSAGRRKIRIDTPPLSDGQLADRTVVAYGNSVTVR